jgi:hypothetical protein
VTSRRVLLLLFAALLLPPPSTAKPIPQAPPRPVLYEQYGRRFEAFHPPEVGVIRERGSRVSLSQEEAEGWSRSALIVMMQKGPVVYLSRADNVLAAPPFVVLLEVREQEVSLYAYFMRELYQDAANPGSHVFPIDSRQAKTLSDLLLQEILTQIRASLGASITRKGGSN